MIKLYPVFAVALLIAVPLHAATVTTLDSDVYYTLGGAPQTGTHVNLQALPATQLVRYITYPVATGLLTLKNAAVVQGDDRHGFLQNVRPEGVGRREHYLSAFGANPLSGYKPGKIAFSLNSGYNTFSFEWGSIDPDNVLTIRDNNNRKFTIFGKDILDAVKTLTAAVSSIYFSLTDLAGIKSVVLTSHNAFEIGKVTASTVNAPHVPLPAALPMFGAALLGLFGVRRFGRKS